MSTEAARIFCNEISSVRRALFALPMEVAERPWRVGGWTGKQIIGHMLDSAANNRQRFVRAGIDGSYAGPDYAQDAWIKAHGYEEKPWPTLLEWWSVEHEILMAVVSSVPEERLGAMCTVGEDAPVTLGFLIEDYLRHLRGHLRQLEASAAGL